MQVTSYGLGVRFKYEKAEEVPHQCLLAAKLLDSQSLSYEEGSIKCKVLPLESFNDTRIFDIFNRNAESILGEKNAWHIHQVDDFIEPRLDFNGDLIKQGLELWLCDDLERCPPDKLDEAYSNVYHTMRKGWLPSNPEDYPNIFFEEDSEMFAFSEKFAFFVKKKELKQEDILIRFLTVKFGLKEHVLCDSARDDKIHMWINKEKLSEVCEKFGFEF